MSLNYINTLTNIYFTDGVQKDTLKVFCQVLWEKSKYLFKFYKITQDIL